MRFGLIYFCLFLGSWLHANVVKNFSAELALRHNDPFGQIQDVKGNKYWADLDLKYYYHKPFIDTEGKFDLSLRYNDANFLAFSFNEAQMTYLYKNSQVTYGVQILDWVEIDTVWGLAKLNNAEYFDYFNPEVAGIPGVKYQFRPSRKLVIDLFGSFLYIPQLNPLLNLNAKTNEITSRSPWADLPDAEVVVENPGQPPLTFKINYNIELPSIFKMITQYTVGMNLKYSFADNFYVSGFGIRKPENRLGNSALATIDSVNADISAQITPNVFYHTLFGGQVTSIFLDKKLKAYVSYYTSIPTEKDSISDATEDVLERGGAGLGVTLEQYREDYIGAGFKYTTEKLHTEIGYLAQMNEIERKSIVDGIPRWSGAINLKFDYDFSSKLGTKFDLKYDFLTEDRLYQFKIVYTPTRTISSEIGVEVIGTPGIAEKSIGFWVPYRENDSYFAQLKYTF